MGSMAELFQSSVIFKNLGSDAAVRMTPLFQEWVLQPGDVLSTAGESAEFFFLLEKGTLLLAMTGGRAVVLDTPGDFAALELLSKKDVYQTTVTSLTGGAVFVIRREEFLAFIQEDTLDAEANMHAWEALLDEKAPFAKELETIDIPKIS